MSHVTKGWIKNNSTGAKKSFQYNPTELEYSRSVSYVDISAPGMPYPNTQFIKGDVRSFPVTLFFYDNPSSGLISSWIRYLEGFVPPESNVSYTKPPVMTFCYGYFIKKCVVENLSVKIERIDESGNPIQAQITLQLRQVGA